MFQTARAKEWFGGNYIAFPVAGWSQERQDGDRQRGRLRRAQHGLKHGMFGGLGKTGGRCVVVIGLTQNRLIVQDVDPAVAVYVRSERPPVPDNIALMTH